MIDKIRKIIWIIVGALTILSLVFALAKKVGLAASSDSGSSDFQVSELPFSIGSGIGTQGLVLDQEWLASIDNRLRAENANRVLSNFSCIVIDEFVSENNFTLAWYANTLNYYGEVYNYSFVNLVVSDNNSYNLGLFDYRIYIYYRDGNVTFSSRGGAGYPVSFYSNYLVELNPSGTSYQYAFSHYQHNYPVYLNSYSINLPANSNTDVLAFQLYSEPDDPIPSGHSKGNVIINYEDSIDQVEDNSSLPSVDVTPPSDPSNNASWFQKILNGLKTINQNLKAGVVTIGDYIGQGIQDLKDHIETMTSNIQQSIQLVIDNFNEKFSDLRDWIEGVKDKVEEIANYLKDAFSLPTSDQVAELLNQFLVGTTFGQFLGISNQAVQVIGSVFGQDIPEFETLVFTFNIDFFGQTFPLVLDFGFYTSSVRNTVVGVFLTFFYIGFLIHIIHQLPSIISGSSGVEKDISPIVKDQVKHTRWNMGLHN